MENFVASAVPPSECSLGSLCEAANGARTRGGTIDCDTVEQSLAVVR
jgi:hypothetical protein